MGGAEGEGLQVHARGDKGASLHYNRSMTFLRAAALIALAAVALYACASTPTNNASQPAATISVQPPTPPAPGDTAPSVGPRPPRSADPVPEPTFSPNGIKPPSPDGGCGCSPCEPIKSTDACQSDADCAPSAVCHAPACVAKSKAPVKAPGTMCTMNLVCRTTDVAKCACVDNVCALVGR